MSTRRAALLLGSAGFHAAALALVALVATRAGFPPALVVDLSAWEQAAAQPPRVAAPRRATEDGVAATARPSAPASAALLPPPSVPPAGAAAMAQRVALKPAAAAASIEPAGPGETRPGHALAGNETAGYAGERPRAPLEVTSPAPEPARGLSQVALPATHPAEAGSAPSGTLATATAAADAAPRGEAGAGASAGGVAVLSRGGEGGRAGGRGEGSRLALALPGEGRGGAPAEYGPYLARFRQRVQDGLVYPLAARRRGLSGTVELDVLIDPSGNIQRVEIASSSSHALLDEAAVEAVRQMAPLPLPETLPPRPLSLRLPLVFELR